jgi:hypothetical protein
MTWPDQPTLDPVRRLRALAGGIRGASVTERVLDAPFDKVWAVMGDLDGRFREFQPDMRRFRVIQSAGADVRAHARSRFGMRAHFEGELRPGWCWLQSRFVLIGMAASPEPGGSTRVALTGGVRWPGRGSVLRLGARREASRSLSRLAEILDEVR